MSDKIITITLMEKTLNTTMHGGLRSITIQEDDVDTIALIEQVANEMVVRLLKHRYRASMIVDSSGLKLIADLMKSVRGVNWGSCHYCFINPEPTTVNYLVENGDGERSTSSSELNFFVDKSDVISVENEKAVTVKGMTKYLEISR